MIIGHLSGDENQPKNSPGEQSKKITLPETGYIDAVQLKVSYLKKYKITCVFAGSSPTHDVHPLPIILGLHFRFDSDMKEPMFIRC